jgi:hypothetical protein
MFILAVAINLNKLLENRGPASCTLDSIVDRVVIVAVHLSIVLIVRILGSKDSWADGTREVFNMILVVQSRDVASAQSLAT